MQISSKICKIITHLTEIISLPIIFTIDIKTNIRYRTVNWERVTLQPPLIWYQDTILQMYRSG